MEFRKRRPKEQITDVLIYATSPTCKVVGSFKVDSIEEGTPQSLWTRYSSVGGIEKSDYEAYYDQCDSSVAIVVGEVTCFQQPLEIEDVNGKSTPPQSFEYVSQRVLEKLRPAS